MKWGQIFILDFGVLDEEFWDFGGDFGDVRAERAWRY